ncbi:MAG: cell envelope integrity protein TolA [Thiogranum sp.]|nr:cell envelope integrity protein TolA [Thiogranum sp.]
MRELLQFLRTHPRPFIYAVLVHGVLLAVLIVSLDWSPTVKPGAHKAAPVQAVAVDAGALEAEVQRLQQLEEQKQRAAQEKVEALERQAAEAERKRQQEEQRLAEVKRKQEQEIKQQAEAERKRKLEQETRAKAAAEQKRKEEEAARKQAEAEQQRKQEEARKQAEAEQKRKQEEARKQAEAEQKRKEEEARKKAEAAAEQKRREEVARKKAEEELQGRLAAEQAAENAQRQSAMDRIIGEYSGWIRDKVARNWIQPPGSDSGLSCTVEVSLIPSGDVTNARIVRSSGNAAFDRSVEAAVFRASPLPVPRDPEVMAQFRVLIFEFKPGSI